MAYTDLDMDLELREPDRCKVHFWGVENPIFKPNRSGFCQFPV